MTGNDDDLFRMFSSFYVGDYVVTGSIRKLFRSQQQVHAHRSQRCKPGDHIAVLGRDCSSRNFRGVISIAQRSSVRKSKLGTSRRAIQRCHCAETRRRGGSAATINYCLTISVAAETFRCHLPVKARIEQYDLSCDLVSSQSS